MACSSPSTSVCRRQSSEQLGNPAGRAYAPITLPLDHDQARGGDPLLQGGAWMTKAELVDKLAVTLQLTKHQTATVVDLFLQCITDALRKGDKVELRGLGSFRLRHRRPR